MHAIYGTYQDSVGLLIKGYFERATGYPVTGPFSALAWVKDGKIVGQCIFNDFTGANVEIHLQAPNCMNKKTIRDVYNYVFNICKCERLTAKPYCNNEKLLSLLERLGFVYECVLEKYYKEGDKAIDAICYKLTKDTLPKWMKLHV